MKKIIMAVIAMMMAVCVSAQFYIYLSNGSVLEADSISTVAPSGSITPSPIVDGVLPGEFSVSAGQKVHFSQGNLQYVGTWRFAEHQYDYFGADQTDNHRDLFGWGTGNNPNLVSTNDNDYATFVDWGTNAISNGGNEADRWRTLTAAEWVYLFEGRPNADWRWGFGSVNGANGIILLPDDWTLPDGATFNEKPVQFISYDIEDGHYYVRSDNFTNYKNNKNIYTAEQWAVMEAAGAVFLPVTNMRNGTNTGDAGVKAHYWAATPSGTDAAYNIEIQHVQSPMIYLKKAYKRRYGFSVRLVRRSM
jgi:uncharacterized protein (TIGR02145 family)